MNKGSGVDPVWYTRETLRSAFPPRIPIKRRFVASLYSAYFDESGTHAASDTVAVAGFVSNVTQWDMFSQKWGQVLKESKLEYFHMTDFENSQGQFSGWSKEEKHDLLNKLLPIISEHTFWSVGCVVDRNLFDAVLSDVAKKICGDAYGFAAMGCWRHFGLVLQKHDAWMDCTMDKGAKGRDAIETIFHEDIRFPEWNDDNRIIKLSFEKKEIFLPLQASDILAYELCKQWARQSGKEKRRQRYPLTVLGKIKHQWHYASEAHLKEYDEDINRQLREMRQRS